MHLEDRFADTKVGRRRRGGIGAGVLSGLAFGLVLGSAFGPSGSAVSAVAAFLGAAAGAVLGKVAADRVSLDELDRNPSDRPYVGAHTPDDESE